MQAPAVIKLDQLADNTAGGQVRNRCGHHSRVHDRLARTGCMHAVNTAQGRRIIAAVPACTGKVRTELALHGGPIDDTAQIH